MAEAPDLSKIVGLIMENPDIISKIQSLAKADEAANESETAEEVKYKEDVADEKSESSTSKKISEVAEHTKRRAKLLHAMKPYLSAERGKAINSMLSMAEILDMMKSR